ncbi:tropomodulin isoform X3 [Daphnia magna]|uniref:tropomodulin isoform X3 n=1 Tax=Daphnia magna TaxID=35525 RepID=UPI001E1BD3D1|nr:tropomodulin isoform X3 [Daphnia magna]
MTSKKLYGKDLKEFDDVDVDDLLTQLSAEELEILSKEVDPDDRFMPPDQRTNYHCEREPTGPVDRKQLIEHINKIALETPDQPENVPFVAGVVRGKKWIPPEAPVIATREDEGVSFNLEDEYEQALGTATEEELVDLAAILGFHSMMNQDQYHASLLNKGKVGLGWDGVTKASQPKALPFEPPNTTDPEQSILKVYDDDSKTIELCFNNINLTDDQFDRLFKALEINTRLEVLSLSNTGLTDRTAEKLAIALEKNATLRVINIETNQVSANGIVRLVKSLLVQKNIEEFRASNQLTAHVLGNKAEMDITQCIEQNTTLMRVGLFFEFNDARSRVANHLQKNIDRNRLRRTGRAPRNLTAGYILKKDTPNTKKSNTGQEFKIDSYCRTAGLVIAGYYHASEALAEMSPDIVSQRICEKIAEYFPNACLVLINNRQLAKQMTHTSLSVVQYCDGGKWKVKDKENFKILPNNDSALDSVSNLLSKKLYKKLVDFDDHFDDISQDWLNVTLKSMID